MTYSTLYVPPKTIFIPVGTPLMGKSTWIRKTLPTSFARISRDDIRKAISRPVSLGIGKFYETITDKAMEENIEHLWWESIKWNMKRQVPIVVDTTNLTYKGRHRICTMAKEYGYHTIIVTFSHRNTLGECINTDLDLLFLHAKQLYKMAYKLPRLWQYKKFLDDIGISSPLCYTLLERNYTRLKRENIFINPKVLGAMLRRMYTDYPYRAYLSWQIQRVKIADIPHPCIDRCHKVKPYIAKAKPPRKPTMEGKEW